MHDEFEERVLSNRYSKVPEERFSWPPISPDLTLAIIFLGVFGGQIVLENMLIQL
jgi:hypothetical protein